MEIPAPEGADAFIAFVGDRAKLAGLKLCRELRLKGLKVEMDDMARNIKGQFKYDDRLSVRNTIIIGEDELAEGKVSIKDMESGQQTQVDMDKVFDRLKGDR